MKKVLLLLTCLIVMETRAQNQYIPDVLGQQFEQLTIEQPAAFDGQCFATVVRHKPLEGVDRAVLYVHGYNDYFFQTEMAEKFVEQGWQFYAVDLRRYGRSMREWHSPFAVNEIEEYFEDIDAAIAVMEAEGMQEIVLMGHSTGGLTTSLYCHANRDDLKVDALILNSPFFDMNLGGWFVEDLCLPVISGLGSLFPDWRVHGGSEEPSSYARSLSDQFDGEWSFDSQFKRVESLPITASWLRAIYRAQRTLQRGLDIPCPVLMLRSDNSVWGDYGQEYMSGDSVLDVADMAKYAQGIGDNVTEVVVEGGMHDLVLSKPEVRYPLYGVIFEWMGAKY